MKKSLSAIIVVILTLIGANALAAKVDFNVKKAAKDTQDATSSQNGNEGGGTHNMVTREK